MKSFCRDDRNNNTVSSLLAFSLSSNVSEMGENGGGVVHHHHNQTLSSNPFVSAPASASHLSSGSVVPQLGDCGNNGSYGVCYGTGEIYSHLPVMPLRSDGSLCLMEALNRSSHQPNQDSTPKMEDFFGGALTMGTHHHNSHKEAMALSLDSIFYNAHESNAQDSLKIFQENPSSQDGQHYPFNGNFHEIRNHEETHDSSSQSTALQLQAEMKTLVSRNYENDPGMTQAGSVGMEAYGELQQSLSLSMSPGSQSSCVTGSHQQFSSAVLEGVGFEPKKRGQEVVVEQRHIVHRKSIDTFGQRTSQYRGVTRHRWTGRYEAHLWDNSYKKEGQSRKGRQVYLGGYDMEEKAARAYDLAALKYWGPSTHTNFPAENYRKEIEEMGNMTRQEYVAHLRRKSSGFSRGASIYRGVTRHHQHGRWQARIGRVAGNKDLYLGTFGTQEEAAEAYDVAAIKFRGTNAVTNFDITRYDVERIMSSNTLLSGELARKNIVSKESSLESDVGHNVVLDCSREGNSDRVVSFPTIFAIPQVRPKMMGANASGNMSTWTNPNDELKTGALALPQMPVFAAWADL
ncbi:PREDICTED: AP2-like ethylene-responsive transcription factor ANT [Tarenaya hassleriana]|uniref:AP2-like ethylene-responsive transcription factor ANT n=1 Tax=Tarenaya hassleriana TaxID=28532 RepID=UPI00053CA4EA|nr:PREDICTED: AP2-like ethylene-responsive transcription factor ANT [Tarenaya hassleriana]